MAERCNDCGADPYAYVDGEPYCERHAPDRQLEDALERIVILDREVAHLKDLEERVDHLEKYVEAMKKGNT